jgi:hypothetical protein
VLADKIKDKMWTDGLFADAIASLNDHDEPTRCVLDDWVAELWPKINEAKHPGEELLAFERTHRRYVS